MTREFQENTVAIILNEMFNDSKKLKTQMQFDALIENYAERIVKLFFIPDVSNNERSEVAVCDHPDDEVWDYNGKKMIVTNSELCSLNWL